MTAINETKIDIERLEKFIKDCLTRTGFTRLVIGLSGGVDSSLSAALGARALGPDNILGLIMPYKSSDPQSEKDALELTAKFGIKTKKVDISPAVDAFFGQEEVSTVRRGNKMARERMTILFDIAARDNALVLGTSNKTEICLGYSTWYGDSACSLNPLGGLYKRDVRRLAEYVGLPEGIIAKKPSADLWPGQTDEAELGISYDLADRVLELIIEKGERTMTGLLQSGADEAMIINIVERINRFAFKRNMPVIEPMDGQPIPDKVDIL